jgi:hypothetical protein
MNTIFKPNEVDIEKITLKNKINISNDFTNYPIKYKNNNLIIQTPIVYLPFGINKYNNKSYIDISFINIKNDSVMREFKELIVNIHNCIKKKVSKKIKFASSFKSTEYYPDRLRLSFYEDILVFNEAKSLITLEYVKSKIYSKLLIIPQFLWTNNEVAGIVWNILQMKIYSKPMLDTYSFRDDEVNIDKYVKMMRCGVPVKAIQNKMSLEKIDPVLLDKFLPKMSNNDTAQHLPIHKLKKIPKENKVLSNKSESQSGFRMTMDQLKNIKLKKTNNKKIPVPFTHMNPFVNPNELQAMKHKILNELPLPHGFLVCTRV